MIIPLLLGAVLATIDQARVEPDQQMLRMAPGGRLAEPDGQHLSGSR